MSTDAKVDRIEGGYSGFYIYADVPHGAGVRSVRVTVPLETILELAAYWRACPTASAGHVAHHRDRRISAPCSGEGEPDEHRAEVAKIQRSLEAIERRPDAPRFRAGERVFSRGRDARTGVALGDVVRRRSDAWVPVLWDGEVEPTLAHDESVLVGEPPPRFDRYSVLVRSVETVGPWRHWRLRVSRAVGLEQDEEDLTCGLATVGIALPGVPVETIKGGQTYSVSDGLSTLVWNGADRG